MRSSLERRLGRAVLSFGAALSVTYLVVIPQVALKTEDAVLWRLTAAQVERLREDPDALLPASMVRLSTLTDLPMPLRNRLLALPEGVHELNDVALTDAGTETDLFVGVVHSGDANRIVSHDVAALEAFDARVDAPGYYVLVILGAGLSLGLALFGAMTGRRVFRSLRSLGRLIATTDVARARAMLAEFGSDEIGVLAHRHLETRDELDRALLRERNFTRDASHELRTPVAIAAGAVELLEREIGDTTRARDLLARMRSAHGRIEELIIVFLWLARSDSAEGEATREPASRLVNRVVQTLEQQAGRPLPGLQVRTDGVHDVVHLKPLGDVVLRNLLHNALRHGVGGDVTVSITPHEIVIENPESGDRETPTRDHGFGQSIVAELCTRLGWRVAFEPRPGRYTVRLSTMSWRR